MSWLSGAVLFAVLAAAIGVVAFVRMRELRRRGHKR